MKRNLASAILFVFAFNVNAQMTEGSDVTASNGTIHFLYYTPPNYRSSGAGHPLIISLGGVGERGDGSSSDLQNLYVGGIPKKIHDGTNMVFSYNTTTDGFVVLAPQLPKTSNWQNFYVDEMISYGLAHFNIDPSRIFLTGYSLGGIGTWDYATTSANINKLAGIVPISSNSDFSTFCNIASNKVAVWAFQGAQDAQFGGNTEHNYVLQINACSNLVVPAVDTIVPDFVHGDAFWNDFVYSPSNNVLPANVFQWMLTVNRNINVATNAPPVPVIANGSTINLVTPVKVKDFPVLDGSPSHDDDIIINYLWEVLSAPSGVTVTLPQAQWPVTPISAGGGTIGMPVGTYNFRLRVKDYLTSAVFGSNNHTKFANITVNINYPASGFSAPATDAGGSVTISGTTTQVLQIVGNAFSYPCTGCNVTTYGWTQVSGPAATLSNFHNSSQPYPGNDNAISFTNLNSPGVYQFQFSATTQHGDVGTDIFTITKLGALPVTYSYFNGQNAGNINILSWATSAETNSERFDVLRSTDGINFTVIGSVTSTGGTVLTKYSFNDNNAPPGLSYYRLSQVDKDGHSALSSIVTVSNKKTGLYIEKYPNPVHDNLAVTLQGNTNGTTKIVIADMQGKTILQQQWQKDQSVIKKFIYVGTLQNGVYQMIVTVGQEKLVSSFVKY